MPQRPDFEVSTGFPSRGVLMIRRFVAIAGLVLAPLASAAGQSEARPNVFTVQPLNAVFQFYSAEYERAATKAVTWGLGGNYSTGIFDGDLTYASGEFKMRYYPAGTALQGFSVGGAAGYTRVSDGTSSAGGPSLGVLLEYQWLLGERKNFAVALGVGAKALLIESESIGGNDVTARYPTARISVGWAY
jgi:hypothetical protein